MMSTVTPRHFLSIANLDPYALRRLLDFAAELKREPRGDRLGGKVLALVFEKASLRTRLSFEVAMFQQGGRALYFSPAEVGLGQREPVKDVARVLGRQVDAIACRTFGQHIVEELAAYAGVPVINALTDTEHPCQALADLLTIQEKLGTVRGKKIAYIGDANNVAVSLMLGAASLGGDYVIACPEGYDPPDGALSEANRRAADSGGSVGIVRSVNEAAEGADVLYTDVWTSMGQEKEQAKRKEDFAGYCLTMKVVGRAAPGVIVMHDLPAHRGEEIDDEVMESAAAVVWDQAENRMHAQKALLIDLLDG